MWSQGISKKTLFFITLSALSFKAASAEGNKALDFDRETLKTLGIDPAISEYFSHEARFSPGEVPVTLKVNGNSKGSAVARFSPEGELCLDEDLLNKAELRPIAKNDDSQCFDYRRAWPTMVVAQHPGQEELDLIVPTDALVSKSDIKEGDYQTGGNAGMLNYSLFTTRNEMADTRSDYSQAMLNGGFNIEDWLFRSQQMLNYTDGKYSTNNSSTWVQHTFVNLKTIMRAGEVNLNNTLLDGASIYGVTFSPDTALNQGGNGAAVDGIARTSQARVEVRQNNKLIYSALVPQGPFKLTDLPLIDRSSDLAITVVETDGTQQYFLVPAIQYNQNIGSPPGMNIAFGRVNDDYQRKPWVGSISVGKTLADRFNLQGAVIAAERYQAAAASMDMLFDRLTTSIKLTSSNDQEHRLQGQKATLAASYALVKGFSLRGSVAHATQNYRTLSDSLSDDEVNQNKNEYSVGLNWSNDITGSLNLSYYQTESYKENSDSRYLSVGWAKSFNWSTLSVNWQHQIGGDEENNDKDLVYVNVSIPLGKANANIYSRHEGDKNRYGTSVNGSVNDELSYSVGAEKSAGDNANSVNGGINANLHYTQLSLNASADDDHSRNYSASLQGGIVAHGNGVTFSPWQLNDTFAIARLNDKISGVKIDTPQGPVWTDAWGQAVVPALPPYRDALVQVNTETLPRNVDVGNGTRRLKQGRGSVGNVNFRTLEQRRAMLYVTQLNGNKLPRGIIVEDETGNYITTAVDDGIVFINNAKPQQTLIARLDNSTCRFQVSLPEKSDPTHFYDSAKEVCK